MTFSHVRARLVMTVRVVSGSGEGGGLFLRASRLARVEEGRDVPFNREEPLDRLGGDEVTDSLDGDMGKDCFGGDADGGGAEISTCSGDG